MTRSTLRTLFAIFSVLIMCTTAFFSMSGEVFGLINPIPDNGIGYGDLIVEPGDNLVYQSKSLEHDGNIIIQNTGRFVLDGTYLNIKAISPGEYRIEVQSGGILEIIGNSKIEATDGGTYSILFNEGSIGFIMYESAPKLSASTAFFNEGYPVTMIFLV